MKKDFLDCTTLKECFEWYLNETKGKKRDPEFDLGFIVSLYDHLVWELEDEIAIIKRKRMASELAATLVEDLCVFE